MKGHLTRSGGRITTSGGNPVFLRGVNFGGWLMREAYILHAPNYPEKSFRRDFTKALGEKAWHDLDASFNCHFIRESDFRQVAQWGMNCVRLPFHHRLVEPKAFEYDRKGVAVLKQAVAWAKKHKLYVILDLHGAPGGQNKDWHSDSDGRAELWSKKINRERVYELWAYLADQFKDEEAVAGYDLLNETVIEDPRPLNAFYKNVIKAIRCVDSKHLLFVEPNEWSRNVKGLEDVFACDNKIVMSVHSYEPLDATFNFVPFLRYPMKDYDRSKMMKLYEGYARFAADYDMPVHVGEFGVNWRGGQCGEDRWLKDALECFSKLGFHWNYWTYKAIKNSAFPDGIFSYYPNVPWVNRLGPKMGWDTYARHWPTRKKDIMESWHTEHFTLNQPVLELLKHAAKNHKFR